jgi:hypothetical protein
MKKKSHARYYQNLLHRYLVFKPKLTVLSTTDSDFLYRRRLPFPSAEVLFASLGNGALKEECVIPNLAEALPGQEASIKKDVMYYNNFLYYAGLACELRFSTQHINWQNDD